MLVATRSLGAPNSPRSLASQPSRRSRAFLPASRPAEGGGGCAAEQPHGAGLGQAEEIDQPAFADDFQLGGDRRHDFQRGILIPEICQQARAQSRWQCAAIHEAEVTAAALGCCGWRAEPVQLLEDGLAGCGLPGQGAGQSRPAPSRLAGWG